MSATEHRDVVVVGAGPAGLAATAALVAGGLTVRLIDEQPTAGGQVWRGAEHRLRGRTGGLSRADRDARSALEALAHPAVDHARGATLVDARLGGDDAALAPTARAPSSTRVEGDGADAVAAADDVVTVTWLARGDDGAGGGGLRDTTARALVIATGAMERAVLFPGAELPGVMSVGAVQGAFKQGALVPGGPDVVFAGHGPLLHLTLAQVRAAGGAVSAVLDLSLPHARRGAWRAFPGAFASAPALLLDGARLLHGSRADRAGGTEWIGGVSALRAHGTRALERLSFETAGRRRELSCRLLAVHDGVVPNVQLSRLLGLEHVWDSAQQAFAPVCDEAGRTRRAGVWIAGDGRGIGGAGLATLRGRLAGLDIVHALGGTSVAPRDVTRSREHARLRRTVRRRLGARRFVDRLYPALPLARHADDGTVVCRCEGVTLGQIHAAIEAGAVGANRVKTFTRCGMGPCQGRGCGNALARILDRTAGVSVEAAGALRVRPPLKPVLIGDYLSSVSEP